MSYAKLIKLSVVGLVLLLIPRRSSRLSTRGNIPEKQDSTKKPIQKNLTQKNQRV